MTSSMLVQCVLLKVCRTDLHCLFVLLTPPLAQLFVLFIISICPFRGERELKWPPATTSWVFWEDCPLAMCRQCSHLPFTAQKVSLKWFRWKRSLQSLNTDGCLCWVTHACLTSRAGLVPCQHDTVPKLCPVWRKWPFIKCNWWHPDELSQVYLILEETFSFVCCKWNNLLFAVITVSLFLLQHIPVWYT